MERIFIREEAETYQISSPTKQKIGVLSMCGGAGATFISSGIGYLLSRSKAGTVAYIEAGLYLKGSSQDYAQKAGGIEFTSNGLYTALAMDKRFALRGEFTDIFKEAEAGGNIRNIINIDEGINWALVKDKNDGGDKIKTIIRTLNNINGQYVIADFGAISQGEYLNEVLLELDHLIYIIDPLPSKLIQGFAGFSEIKRWELHGNKVTYVVNKMNNAVSKRELEAYLKLKKYIAIEALPLELFYEAEYRCKIPISNKKIYKEVGNAFEKLHKAIT